MFSFSRYIGNNSNNNRSSFVIFFLSSRSSSFHSFILMVYVLFLGVHNHLLYVLYLEKLSTVVVYFNPKTNFIHFLNRLCSFFFFAFQRSLLLYFIKHSIKWNFNEIIIHLENLVICTFSLANFINSALYVSGGCAGDFMKVDCKWLVLCGTN